MAYNGPWMNERQPGKWEDCVAASGVNMYNAVCAKWLEKPRPVTDAEREALRIASDDTQGGMSLASLANGMEDRYGHRPRHSTDWDLMGAPQGGDERWWVVTGNWQDLPAELKHWQPSGQFIHACAVGPGRKVGERKWIDPLATDGWPGEYIDMPSLHKFMATQGFRAVSFAIAPGTITGGPVEDPYAKGRQDEWDVWDAFLKLAPKRP